MFAQAASALIFYGMVTRLLLTVFEGTLGGAWLALACVLALTHTSLLLAWRLVVRRIKLFPVLLFAPGLVVYEAVISQVVNILVGTGFPHSALGLTAARFTVLSQLAALGGVPLLSLLVGFVSAGIAVWMLPATSKLEKATTGLLSVLAILMAVAYGVARQSIGVTNGVVKILLASEGQSIDHVNLSCENTDVRFLIGPETLGVATWTSSGRMLPESQSLVNLLELGEHLNRDVITGVWLRVDGHPNPLNAVVRCRDGHILEVAAKRCLVPMVESTDEGIFWSAERFLAELFSWQPRFVSAVSSYKLEEIVLPNQKRTVVDSVSPPTVAVCYDIFFSRWVRHERLGPFIVCCSREPSDPTGLIRTAFHLHCQLRAIESGRSVVGVVAGGNDVAFDRIGLPLKFDRMTGGQKTVDAPLESLDDTFYMRFGDLITPTCVFVIIVFIAAGLARDLNPAVKS